MILIENLMNNTKLSLIADQIRLVKTAMIVQLQYNSINKSNVAENLEFNALIHFILINKKKMLES